MALAQFRLESCDQPRTKPTTPPVDDTHTHRLHQSLTGRRHRELAMLHTLDRYQRIRHIPDLSPSAFHHQDLKTMVMVEMDMHTGHNVALKVVLDMRQFSRQVTDMAVVHKGYGPDRLFVVIPLLSDQVVTDQVPQRLRAVGILAPLDVQIEIIKQMMVQRHAESNELLHSWLGSST